MEEMELACFQIISCVGTARSLYIEAIQAAKAGDFDESQTKISEGNEMFNQGHHVHMSLIQNEASGNRTDLSMLLIHSEDLLMSAESFRILALEFIDLYTKCKHNCAKLDSIFPQNA
jgi:PTS system cellobiose-specific IIA component